MLSVMEQSSSYANVGPDFGKFSLSAKAEKQNNKDSATTARCFIDFIFTPYLILETEPFGFAKKASKLTSG